MSYQEPTHTNTVRSTEDSNTEGRLKVGINRKKKRKIIKKVLDGQGGCGTKKGY